MGLPGQLRRFPFGQLREARGDGTLPGTLGASHGVIALGFMAYKVGGFLSHGGTQKWMVIRENPDLKWMMTGGTSILGNPHTVKTMVMSIVGRVAIVIPYISWDI